jgi:hypothetical protein
MNAAGPSLQSRFATLGKVILGAAVFFVMPEVAQAQCAMCRDAVAASSTETREAMNFAIIGLALAPYGVAAAAAWALFPGVRLRVRALLARLVFRRVGENA